jgi:IS30 family transposase
MTNSKEERAARRLVILEGLNNGLTNEKIAKKLGMHPRMVRRDMNRMHHSKDPELKQALINAQEKILAEKKKKSNRAGDHFKSVTGMTFQEKTFNNMMSFYEPEIRKIMRAKNQDVAIRNLPSSVVKTLKRNGIIAPGWKTPQVTQKALIHLAGSRLAR